ncbi:ROK family transcriptional regulator [Micromonospora sp. NPDC126480]|uniref:ROK family transcriptional regulator n=1 Tax=Micromonospora sp. NPDC126480 TaxID=3155312 RepID=UPI0033311326
MGQLVAQVEAGSAMVPPTGSPADQTTVRRSNLSLVLRYLSTRGPASRAAIAAETGLNKTTVSSLISELQARGLVTETGLQQAGAVGRPGRAISLDGATVGALGLEINVDYIATYGLDLTGRTLIDRRVGFDAMGSDVDRSLRQLSQVMGAALTDLDSAGLRVMGITVAVPGLVNVETGTVLYAPNLGWRNVPVAQRLADTAPTVPIPVSVDNDANLAALAEFTVGVAAGTPDLVYLTGEVGVGGGVISGGRLLRGGDGFAGEVGHLPVDPNGDRCGCGRTGCWETKVGLAALVRMAAPDHAYGRSDSGPVRVPEERLAEIERRQAAGDRRVEQALREIARWLGVGGAILVNLLNPRVIVLGGYFARFRGQLIADAQAELDRLVVAGPDARCLFVASELDFRAAAHGAAHVAVERVLTDPTMVAMLASEPSQPSWRRR